ncbi:YihY family inner membrane protein, partial [Myxococcota bacterium]|nr:YihY family inner membrane protein [Myxococcota bacterium]
VVFAIFNAFGGLERMRVQVEAFVISNISGSPEVEAMIGEYLQKFIGNIHTGGVSGSALIILIFVSVLSLLGHIESSFNEIFATTRKRSIAIRIATYWAVLTLGPILLGTSFTLTAMMHTSALGGWVDSLGFIGRGAISAVPLISTWVAFSVMYLVVPATRVKVSSAIKAAIIAGSAWNLAKYFYALYASHAFTLQNIYGSLAAIPLFILWLYVSWLLVLFGAQLALAFQNASAYRPEDEITDASEDYKELALVRIFFEIAIAFNQETSPPSSEEVSQYLRIPRKLVQTLVGEMLRTGFLRQTDPDSGLVPAVGLEKITPNTLIHAWRNRVSNPPPLRDDLVTAYLDALFKKVREERIRLTDEKSFQKLASDFSKSEPSGAEKKEEVKAG